MDEARQSPRRPVLKSGSIRFGDVAVSCVLRNLSPAGAALDVGSQVGIPDQFTLIVHEENAIHSCAIVWRKKKRIGVAFYQGAADGLSTHGTRFGKS